MFCDECGRKIDDNAVFCPECGNKIVNKGSEKKKSKTRVCKKCGTTVASNVVFCPVCGKRIKKSKKRVIVIILLILLAVVIIPAGIYFLNKIHTEREEEKAAVSEAKDYIEACIEGDVDAFSFSPAMYSSLYAVIEKVNDCDYDTSTKILKEYTSGTITSQCNKLKEKYGYVYTSTIEATEIKEVRQKELIDIHKQLLDYASIDQREAYMISKPFLGKDVTFNVKMETDKGIIIKHATVRVLKDSEIWTIDPNMFNKNLFED